MSYQIKRIDPYWITHPAVPLAGVAGIVIGIVGVAYQKQPLTLGGAGLLGVSVLLATRPVVSAVLGGLGLLGGLATFVLLPNQQVVELGLPWKLLSSLLFTLLYTVLMDALVLAVAFLYNLFGLSLGGVGIDIEESEGERGG